MKKTWIPWAWAHTFGATAAALAIFAAVQSHEFYELECRYLADLERAQKLTAEVEEKHKELASLKAIIAKPERQPDQTLAVSNNNPANIKSMKGRSWEGQVGTDKHGHAIFATPEHGIRAASLVLRSYAMNHKIDTVRGLVTRFAHGNREPYIKYLCNKLGVEPDQEIGLIRRMPELLRHMTRFESGRHWPERYFAAYDILAKL